MSGRRWLAVAVITLAMVSIVTASQAGQFNRSLSVGDKGPNFANLVGTDDQRHNLADYKDARFLVVVFTCNHCPVATAYEDRLIAYARDYKNKGVQVVAINVNNIEDDKLPAMKVRAQQKGFPYPYLYDPSQQTARMYGATVTPHVFVLDKNRTVAYMGSVDDSQQPARITHNFLREATDALLSGQKPATTETRQFGCSIKYE